MSWLTLVRHTQASFHGDHYDQLSPLGQQQACLLGELWARQRVHIDAIYVGPRSRQRRTAEIVADCYARAGAAIPQPVMLQELDEYDLNGILECLAPNLAKTDEAFARLYETHGHGETNRERERNFQAMFEPLLKRWQALDGPADGFESWKDFGQRVGRGLSRMMQQPGKSRRVIAFTSGGFIGTATQQVLGAPAVAALELNWRIRNGAVTEFVFSGERVSLECFNNTAHFADAELVTYR